MRFMTAKAEKRTAKRDADDANPGEGTKPTGSDAAPGPEASPPEPVSDPESTEEADAEKEEEKPAPPPAAKATKAVKTTTGTQPSVLGRFFGWWFSDLDGN